MKQLSTLMFIVLSLALCASLTAQPVSMMKHKVADLDVTFEIPNTWKQIDQPDQDPGFGYISPDTVVHLVIKPLKVEGNDAVVVLNKVVKKLKLKAKGKPIVKEIGKLKRATIRASGLVKGNNSIGTVTIIFYRDRFYLAFMYAPIVKMPRFPDYVREFENSFHTI